MFRPIWAEKEESANCHFVVKTMRKVGGSYAQGFGVGPLLRQSTLHMLVCWKQRNLKFGGWRGPETYFQGWENSF